MQKKPRTRTVLNKFDGEWIVTTHVRKLSVKVLYGRGMEKKLTISDQTVEVVWQVARLASYGAPSIESVSRNGLNTCLTCIDTMTKSVRYLLS